MISKQLQEIKQRAEQSLDSVNDLSQLEQLRVSYLGKKGEITAILKQMGSLSPEERPVVGELANKCPHPDRTAHLGKDERP